MTRPSKPENMPWMIPYLTVRDVSVSLDFYARAFGFEESLRLPGEGGAIIHGEMKWHDMVFMMGTECTDGENQNPAKAPASTGTPSPMSLYFYVEDVDAAFKRAVEAGCKPVVEPNDAFWGDRMAQVADADGYAWTMATNIADFDPDKIPR